MFGFIHAAVIGPLKKIWAPRYREVPAPPALPMGVVVAVGNRDVLLTIRSSLGDVAVLLTPAAARALAWAAWQGAKEAEGHGGKGP